HRAAKMSQSLDLDAVTLAWLHKKYADSSGRAPRYLRHRLLSPAQLVTETNLEHEHVLGPIAPKYFEAWRRTRALRILSGSDEQTRQSWRDYLDQVPQSGSVLIDPLFAIPEYMKTLARLLGCTEQAVAVLYSARAIPESAM